MVGLVVEYERSLKKDIFVGGRLCTKSGRCLARKQHAGKRFTHGLKCQNVYLFLTLIVRMLKEALWIRSS